MNAPRFEVVRTDADQPWHARFRAANGRIVWVTENYHHRKAAEQAVDIIARTFDAIFWRRSSEVRHRYTERLVAEVRYIDLRTPVAVETPRSAR